MKAFTFGCRFGGGAYRGASNRLSSRRRAATGSQPTQNPSTIGQVVQAGVISGSLSLAGDVLAQLLANRDRGTMGYDVARAARMGSFGLAFYGPYQHFWYRALDRAFTAKTVGNFAAKVAMNQLCLAPVVITCVFAWNLALQGQAPSLRGKLEQDFVPTLVNGWKFWVPAASVNFLVVPVQHQVLYMSACGVLWTAYLSHSSALKQQQQQ